jgi:hypothetical protein
MSGRAAGYVAANSVTAPATVGSGDGSTAAEQFVAIHPDAPTSVLPILPGDTVVLQSVATGQYCRLAPLSTSQNRTGMRCDLPTLAQASRLSYTGSSLTADGVALVAASVGSPLLLANSTGIAGLSPDDLSFPPAGPLLAANSAVNIQAAGGAYVRVDNITAPAFVAYGTGTSPAEQFIAAHPAAPDSTAPIQPGQTAILRSVATAAYCRLVPMPANTTQLGVVCDQPSAATATPLLYSGSGLSYNGVPLAATAPGAPLLMANTTAAPATPTSDDLTFPAAITGGGRLDNPQPRPALRSKCAALTHALTRALTRPSQARSRPTCPTTSWGPAPARWPARPPCSPAPAAATAPPRPSSSSPSAPTAPPLPSSPARPCS